MTRFLAVVLSLAFTTAAAAATADFRVTVNGPDRVDPVPERCTVAGNAATCAVGTMEPHPYETINPIRTLRFEAIPPDIDKATISYFDPSNNRDTGKTHTFTLAARCGAGVRALAINGFPYGMATSEFGHTVEVSQ